MEDLEDIRIDEEGRKWVKYVFDGFKGERELEREFKIITAEEAKRMCEECDKEQKEKARKVLEEHYASRGEPVPEPPKPEPAPAHIYPF